MTCGQKICAYIETFCLNPEGAHVGKPIKLMGFQKKSILMYLKTLIGRVGLTCLLRCCAYKQKNCINRHNRSCAPGRIRSKAKQHDHLWCVVTIMHLLRQWKPAKVQMMTRFLSRFQLRLPRMVISSLFGSMMQKLWMIRGLFRISIPLRKIANPGPKSVKSNQFCTV